MADTIRTQTDPPASTGTPPPYQPTYDILVMEAESASPSGDATITADSKASGGKKVVFIQGSGAVTFTFDRKTAGPCTLIITAEGPFGNMAGLLTVNGVKQDYDTYRVPGGNGMKDLYPLSRVCVARRNVITVESLYGYWNIDKMTVSTPITSESFWWKEQAGGRYVTPVKDQAGCAAAWPQVGSALLETYYSLGYDQPATAFSAQQGIDCSSNAQGCATGWPTLYFVSAKGLGGAALESNYGFNGNKGNCNNRVDKSVQITNTNQLVCNPGDEACLMTSTLR